MLVDLRIEYFSCLVVTASLTGMFLPLFILSPHPPWTVESVYAYKLLLGKSHGRRSLVDCSPWGCEESEATE